MMIALFALLVASGAMLSLPRALKNVIDKGFSTDQIQLISRYFLLLLLADLGATNTGDPAVLEEFIRSSGSPSNAFGTPNP